MSFLESRPAKKIFKKGDRVILSIEGCVHLPGMIKKQSHGVVVGFGKQSHLVRILPDGLKTASTFHSSFWERL